MVKTIANVELVKMSTAELEAIVDSDGDFAEETVADAFDELDRRDFDESDPSFSRS